MSFGSFPLSSLPLSKAQLSACELAGYHTASDILLAAPTELNRKLKNLTTQNIQGIVRLVAKSIAPVPKPVVHQRREDEGEREEHNGESSTTAKEGLVGTGDVGLDEVLGGGLRLGTLTEIAGESAAGKSHLCMVLALSAQLPACTTRPGGAVILTSERVLPTDRLVQLAKTALATHEPGGRTTVKELLDNIHTNRCLDIDALDHALSYSLPWELEKRRQAGKGMIRLLVLDSITALLRGSETAYSSSSAGLAQRSKHLCAIADKLKALAVEYELAVVVINQVSDVFTNRGAGQQATATSMTQQQAGTQLNASQQQPGSSSYGYDTQFFTDPGADPPMLYATQARWFSGQSQGYMKEASLGIVWANAVNTRIMLSRTGRRRRVQREALTTASRKRRTQLHIDNTLPVPGEEDAMGIMLDDSTPTLIRKFHVIFSPFAPPSPVDYIISPSGVHTLDNTRKTLDLESIVRMRKKREEMLAAIADGEDLPVPASGGGSEIADEVFDDLGDVPAEFWEGRFEADGGEGDREPGVNSQ